MSKTVGNVIDPIALTKTYGTDPVRYYVLREIPSGEDGDFSYKKFEERYQGDLANGIGNLVARVATLGEKISPLSWNLEEDVEEFVEKKIKEVSEVYHKKIATFRLNEALSVVWELVSTADKYVNEKKPWAIEDLQAQGKIIANAAYIITRFADLLTPFLPETAEKIQAQIAFKDSIFTIKKSGNLFPRLQL